MSLDRQGCKLQLEWLAETYRLGTVTSLLKLLTDNLALLLNVSLGCKVNIPLNE